MSFQLTAIGVFFFSLNLFGQAIFNRISGEVNISGGDPQARYIVELIESARHQSVDRVIVSSTGRFDFPGAAGDYELRLTTQSGELLQSQLVRAGNTNNLELRAEIPQTERPAEGTISVNRLMHKTVPKAGKEFRKATDLWERGDLEGSIEHLKKAVAIDPEFMEAHHDLGCKYLRAGNAQGAVEELRKAIQLDPGSSRAYSNLALVYLRTGNIPDAETAAKRAFALDGQSAMSHYVLGLARLAEKRYDSETLRHLELAKEQFPFAERPAAALRQRMTKSFVK